MQPIGVDIVLATMNAHRRQEFSKAFAEWQTRPITVSDENAFLFQASSRLTHVQTRIAPELIRFNSTGETKALAVAEWYDGMDYLLMHETTLLRSHLRRGRNQVSTRVLIEDATRLQRVWDAYRRLIGA